MKFGKTLGWEHRPYPRAVEQAHREGFDFVEIGLKFQFPAAFTRTQTLRIRKALRDCGMEAGLHAPYAGVQLASPREELRRASVQVVRDSFDFASKLESPYLVVHVKGETEVPHVPAAQRAFRASARASIAELAQAAQRMGVKLCIENTVKTLFQRPADYAPLLALDGAWFCLDAGHVFKAGFEQRKQLPPPLAFARWTRQLRRKLFLCHAHDYALVNGQLLDHLPLGEGELRLAELLRELANAPHCQRAVLEVCRTKRRRAVPNAQVLHSLHAARRAAKEAAPRVGLALETSAPTTRSSSRKADPSRSW